MCTSVSHLRCHRDQLASCGRILRGSNTTARGLHASQYLLKTARVVCLCAGMRVFNWVLMYGVMRRSLFVADRGKDATPVKSPRARGSSGTAPNEDYAAHPHAHLARYLSPSANSADPHSADLLPDSGLSPPVRAHAPSVALAEGFKFQLRRVVTSGCSRSDQSSIMKRVVDGIFFIPCVV